MSNIYNGKYKQLSKIGSGSHGVVYLCEDGDKKKVAIKFILERVEGVADEISLMSKLKNPYIIQYVEHFYVGPLTIGIVMIYCEKGDLAKAIKNKLETETKFENEKVFQWLNEITLGLCYLHENNIIHRDIKPSNIFLANDDNIVLGDLGICKEFSTDTTASLSSYNIGTDFYKSPEMINSSSYSYKTDIWSTGCTIFELITLKKYYEKKPLKKYDISSKDLRKLLENMLQEDPEKRLSSFVLKQKIEQMKTKKKNTGQIKEDFNDLELSDDQNEEYSDTKSMIEFNRLALIDHFSSVDILILNSIDLSGNKLIKINRDTFNGLVNLKEIELSRNQLTQIDENTFGGLVNLTTINLNDNHLTKINKLTFSGLSKLARISLSGNYLTQIDDGLFSGLFNLNSINLRGNKLKQIDKKLFSFLVNLNSIDLGRNQLTQLDKNTFNGLMNLDAINLSYNSLTQIDKELFIGLEKLSKIYLHNNRFLINQLELILEPNVKIVTLKDFFSNDIDTLVIKQCK